jgi:hypothetical protein
MFLTANDSIILCNGLVPPSAPDAVISTQKSMLHILAYELPHFCLGYCFIIGTRTIMVLSMLSYVQILCFHVTRKEKK